MSKKRVETTGESPVAESVASTEAVADVPVEEQEPAAELEPEDTEAELVDDDMAALLAQKAALEDDIAKLKVEQAERRKRRGKICMLLYMIGGDWEKSVCIEGTCGWWVALENTLDGGACAWKLLPVVIGDRE